MKSKPSKSDGFESRKVNVKKGAGEMSGATLSSKPQDKQDAKACKKGSPLKSTGIQKKSGHSILHHIYKQTLGQSVHTQMKQCLQEPFIRSLTLYHYHASNHPFDRRVTCLEWHPTHPTTLALGSKGGDIELWDFKLRDRKMFIRGMGAGDSVTDMRFNPLNPNQLFTSSMGGTTALQDFHGTPLTVFAYTDTFKRHFMPTPYRLNHLQLLYFPDYNSLLSISRTSHKLRMCLNGAGDVIGGMKFCPTDLSRVYVASGEGTLTMQSFEGLTTTIIAKTEDCGHHHHNVCSWYCCVDVSISRQMLATGDNVGNCLLVGLDGQKIFSEKLHKAKVTHAEFNPRCDWLLVTASVDHTVKLWDLRNMKDKNSFLYDMPHEKAVNSAYFHPSDCSKLVTTDQYDQIRVYTSSDWSKPQHIIQHPHRHFQHITPIKATWHPVYDLIVVGRYPDDRICPGEQRTIDIFDSNTAELVCQLHDPNVAGIKCINKFNPLGDVIGSGMGVSVVLWDQDESLLGDEQTPQEDASTSAERPQRERGRRQQATRSRRSGVDQSKLKKKLLTAHESETKTKCAKRTRKL